MSFFKLSTGTTAKTDGNFDAGGGDIEPIPEGTKVKAAITEAKWREYEGERYISLRWDIVSGEYAKRVIFQKIKPYQDDEKKADKHKMMLAAIDANCGGKLMQIDGEPGDVEMMKALCNKPMVIRLGVWEINYKQGNWVQATEATSAASKPASKPAEKPVGKKKTEPVYEYADADVGDGDNIPF